MTDKTGIQTIWEAKGNYFDSWNDANEYTNSPTADIRAVFVFRNEEGRRFLLGKEISFTTTEFAKRKAALAKLTTEEQKLLGIEPEDRDIFNMHTKHCCINCGCKYNSKSCSILNRTSVQTNACGTLPHCKYENYRL